MTQVTTNPAINSGQPSVKSATVNAILGLYAAGETLDTVADEYGLTRADVLVACWYAGIYGRRNERRWLREWAEPAGALMWNGRWDEIPDPPARVKWAKR